MSLIDASEFIRSYKSGRVEVHDQLRLNNSGKGNPAYLLDAGIGYSMGVLVLRGTLVLGSNGKKVAKEKVELRVDMGTFLSAPTSVFSMISAGYPGDPMYFIVKFDGTWGTTQSGRFMEKKMFHFRNVSVESKPFEEDFDMGGNHTTAPEELEVLFRELGCFANVPVGDTVEALIDTYAGLLKKELARV